MEKICKDNSTIKALIFPDDSGVYVGKADVDKIIAYQETGDMAFVTWFAVSGSGKIISRVNAAHVEMVVYE